jgi:cobalt-zinc-cadmium efflux system membrane fusion protein
MVQKPLKSLPPVRRPEREAGDREEGDRERPAKAAAGFRLPKWAVGVVAFVGVGVLVAGLAGSGVIEQIRERVAAASSGNKDEDKDKKEEYPKLVRDARGRPVSPPTILLDKDQARALEINDKTVVPAVAAVKPRPLPSMEGQLAYDTERLYSVRPRFAGEVQAFGQVPARRLEKDGETGSGQVSGWKETRPISIGDPVKGPHRANGKEVPGTLLAVIWSSALGDKKAAFIDALIDLRRDQARLADLKAGWEQGVVSKTSYYEAQRTVQKDLNARNTAERALLMWKLTDKEIQDLRDEAARIEQTGRNPGKEMNWARVEVRAPHDGVIVEKNTNKGDWVDPSASPNPMFRIADLRELAVWINAREEYRPVVQEMLFKNHDKAIRMEIRLLAEPDAPPLEGEIVRIAPSLDPNQRTMLVIGRVKNLDKRQLLVGLSVTATILLKPGPGLVEIPTMALNEQDGQSLVFVQPDPKKPAFQMRRVAVAHRFEDVVLVHSRLTDEDKELSRKDVRQGRRPIEPLRPGDRVVTRSVTMLTSAVRDLLANKEPGN